MDSLAGHFKGRGTVFGRVSVVQMASESRRKSGRTGGDYAREKEAREGIFSMGSWNKITPVEQTLIPAARAPYGERSFVCAKRNGVAEAPVAQFALPA